MPFNVNNCHIIQVGRRNPQYEYEMNGVKLENAQCVKDLGVMISSNLKFFLHCKVATCKGNKMLGFITRNFSFKYKNIILPMYIILVRPHLKFAVHFWSPHHARGIAKLEASQRMATKMIPSMRNKSSEERLARLNLFSLEKRRLLRKLIQCFKILKKGLRMLTQINCFQLMTCHERGVTKQN